MFGCLNVLELDAKSADAIALLEHEYRKGEWSGEITRKHQRTAEEGLTVKHDDEPAE